METKKELFTGKSYRLTDSRSGEAFMLKTGRNKRLLHFDEEKGYNRAIRHCPNEASIYIDEQSEHALVEPIIFNQGMLDIKREAQTTQKFLLAHPDNVINKGGWFEEIDEETEAGEDIEVSELITEIKQAVKEKGDEEDGIYALEMVASILLNSVVIASKMTKSELKREIYNRIESNPYYFVDDETNVNIFDDEHVQRKYLTLRAIKDNVIKKSANSKSMMWVSGNKMITTAPQGLDLVDYFADYLSTDDGIVVIDEIKRRT
jgi:hypothetical protein